MESNHTLDKALQTAIELDDARDVRMHTAVKVRLDNDDEPENSGIIFQATMAGEVKVMAVKDGIAIVGEKVSNMVMVADLSAGRVRDINSDITIVPAGSSVVVEVL